MKIHRLGNDYVQANKFKKESVNHVENQTANNRPEPSESLPAETSKAEEATTEEKENCRGRKKKQSD